MLGLNPYDAVEGLLSSSGASAAARPKSASPEAAADFGRALAGAVSRGVQTVREAEASSIRAMEGSEDPARLVNALMQADITLQAGNAIRERGTQAIMEILRGAV
ncbi:flagellar hook-basal body complex protein FliE [Azospirillum sp. SYSU D00513]|uniref:flagellar hook-basal body complex protein FliE n=1 Tax=Azospirillum sp. SYSU D00513 TaxID=2812561 RepID=UPI001A97B7E4|nr:flagellar hook-basal body complex protein FliE [Azospirillum sp. SYSU D00513]